MMASDEQELDHLLQVCLELIGREGASLEEALARYPDQAGELRPLLESVVWLQAHRSAVEPRPGFVSASRGRLVARLQTEKAAQNGGVSAGGGRVPVSALERVNVFMRQLVGHRFAFRTVAVLAVILVLLMGTTGAAFAAQNTIPGDALYPFKRGVEQAELALTPSSQGHTQLHIQFARRRLEEIQALALQGRYQHLPGTVANFQYQLDSAIAGVVEVARQDPTMAQALADNLQDSMAEGTYRLSTLAQFVPASARPSLEQAVQVSQQGVSAAGAAAAGTGQVTPTLFPPTSSQSPPFTATSSPTPAATSTSAIAVTSPYPGPEVITPTSPPGLSETPPLAGGSELKGTPKPTETPTMTPTETRRPSDTPRPTRTPKPSKEPKDTKEPKPTREPKPTSEHRPTPRPEIHVPGGGA